MIGVVSNDTHVAVVSNDTHIAVVVKRHAYRRRGQTTRMSQGRPVTAADQGLTQEIR
jgi:hypothetical protein